MSRKKRKSDTTGQKTEIPVTDGSACPEAQTAPTDKGTPEADVQRTPEQQLDATTAERDDLLVRLQRVSADYVNYQKRVQRDIGEAHQFAVTELVKALLDVLDDLERAIEHAESNHDKDDPLLVGTNLVYQKAQAVLKRFGVEPIEGMGCPFDPSRHEAIMQQPTADAEPMTVVAQTLRGYVLNGRMIRPAKVVVASPLPQEDNGDQADPHASQKGRENADV